MRPGIQFEGYILDERRTIDNVMHEFPVSEEEAVVYMKNIGKVEKGAGCLSGLHPVFYDTVK